MLNLKNGEEFKMKNQLNEYRELLRKCNYPEDVLAKMTDEDCEGECDAIGVSL
ncbi:hypothetical protein BBOR36S_03598 [Brevibacillus borstelensis]